MLHRYCFGEGNGTPLQYSCLENPKESGGLQSMGSLESDTTEQLHFQFLLSYIGEGNGNPLQCSCLENPRDWKAWWAAVYGVAQSRTRLKRLSSSSRYCFCQCSKCWAASLLGASAYVVGEVGMWGNALESSRCLQALKDPSWGCPPF